MLRYDKAEAVDELPRQRNDGTVTVRHRYVVDLDDTWYAFVHLPPALAFGRAGRMSTDVRVYGVFRGAVVGRGEESHIEYLPHERLDRREDERERLTEWLDGVRPERAHWYGD